VRAIWRSSSWDLPCNCATRSNSRGLLEAGIWTAKTALVPSGAGCGLVLFLAFSFAGCRRAGSVGVIGAVEVVVVDVFTKLPGVMFFPSCKGSRSEVGADAGGSDKPFVVNAATAIAGA
jgi:hypothetical protein